MKKPKGWRNESRRHSLASKGIKTAQKIPKFAGFHRIGNIPKRPDAKENYYYKEGVGTVRIFKAGGKYWVDGGRNLKSGIWVSNEPFKNESDALRNGIKRIEEI